MKKRLDGKCPKCESENIEKQGHASGNKYGESECQDCGEWFMGYLVE